MGTTMLQWSMHHIDLLLLGAAAAGGQFRQQPEAALASSATTAPFMLACVLLCAVIAKVSLISTYLRGVGITCLRQAWPMAQPAEPAQASLARSSLALELLCVLGLARWIDPQICLAHPGLATLAMASLARQSTAATLRALRGSREEPRRTWRQADRALYIMACSLACVLCYVWNPWVHVVLLAVHFSWLLAISVQLGSAAAARAAQVQRQPHHAREATAWDPSTQVPGLPILVLAWLVIRQQAAAWAMAALQMNGLELISGQPLQLFHPSGHAMGSPGFALLGTAVMLLAVTNEGCALSQAAGCSTHDQGTTTGQPAQALQSTALRWLNAKFRPELQVMQLALDELKAELQQVAHRQQSASQQPPPQPQPSEACAAFQTGQQALRVIEQVLDGCAAWAEASQLSQFPPTALDWVSPGDEVKAGITSHIPALVKQGVQCSVRLQIGPWQFEGDLHQAVTLNWPDIHLRLAPGLIQSAVYTLLQNVLDHGLLGSLSSRVHLAMCLQPEAAAGNSKHQAAHSSDRACWSSSLLNCWTRGKVQPVLASRATTPGAALDSIDEAAPRSTERAFTTSLPRHLDASTTLQSVCSMDATPSAQQRVAQFPTTTCPRPKLAISSIDDSQRSASAGHDAHAPEARSWHLSIAVRDNGFGIPAAQARQILTPFTTLRPAQKQHGGGLSLCTLSYALQATGGELEISTSLNGQPGTQAMLQLAAPALRSAELRQARHKQQPQRSSSSRTLLQYSSAWGAGVLSASPTLVCTWFHPTAPRQPTPWACQGSEPPLPSAPRRTASFKINSNHSEYFCSQTSPGFAASGDSAIGLQQQDAGPRSCWIRCLHEPSSSRSHHLESAEPRVLAVDDMQSTLRHVVRCVQRAGVYASQIDQASDGAEAVQLVQAALAADQPYSLILCDNTMPVMTGDQAVREMRALGVAVPIIGITGNSEPQDVRAFLEAGATQVLIKPVAISQLLHTIQQALQLPHSRGSVATEVAGTPVSLDGM